MNDPSAPDRSDDGAVEALMTAMRPGDPLAEEVERFLNERGGPVPAPDDQVRDAAARVRAHIQGTQTPRRHLGRWGLAAAAVLLAVAGAAWQGTRTEAPAPVATADLPSPPAVADPSDVEIAPGALAEIQDDLVVVALGSVAVHHTDGSAGAHRVRLSALDVVVEPVGTVFYAGSRGSQGAVWVQEGAVRLLHPRQGHLGEVRAGHWALLAPHPDGSGIEVHRVQDGPFDPSHVGLDADASQLVADLRWLALPLETRTSILEATVDE